MRFTGNVVLVITSFAGHVFAGVSTYAPISQINDGQIQAPTGGEAPPAVPTTWYHNTTKPAGPMSSSAAPPPYPTGYPHSKPSNGTVTVKTSHQKTITSSAHVSSGAPPTSVRTPPPAVQSTGAGSSVVLGGGSGLSFAALVAYILA